MSKQFITTMLNLNQLVFLLLCSAAESGFSMLLSCRNRLKDVCVRVSKDVLDSIPELQPEKLKADCEKFLNVENVKITICRGELSYSVFTRYHFLCSTINFPWTIIGTEMPSTKSVKFNLLLAVRLLICKSDTPTEIER